LALKSDGSLWSWGYNNNGQLGDGTTVNKNAPVAIASTTKWVNIASQAYSSFAIKNNGTLWVWGDNSNYGQLGDGTGLDKSIPTQNGTDDKWVKVDGGFRHCVAEKSDGSLWVWGNNLEGALGIGNFVSKINPVTTSSRQSGILNIALAANHSIALNTDGTIWSWGNNSRGQLGDGTTTSKTSPVKIQSDTNFIAVTTGFEHVMAIQNNGTLWAWGYNNNGQLGNGTNTNSSTPIQIGTDDSWATIAAGEYHNIALKANGTLWAWGKNVNGQLGDGTVISKNSPIQIGTDNTWTSIAIGANYSLALKADGTLWAWGVNLNGQIGDGTTSQRTSPIQIGTDNTWIKIVAGASHTIGLKSNGTLWAWGWNSSSQLGDGTITQRSSPVQIGTDNKWINISASSINSSAVKSDGTLWAWGSNLSGQYGNGTTTNSSTPVIVASQFNIIGLQIGGGASNSHTSVITPNRTSTCLTGSNTNGQLGIGSTVSASIFTCNTALPLSSLNFTVEQQEKSIQLKWKTIAEINTTYFIVQKSSDGIEFKNKDRIEAIGIGNNSYKFIDDLSGLNVKTLYYRLQIFDNDGSFKYSKIIAVTFKLDITKLSVYPNPIIGNSITIDLGENITKPISYTISTIHGKPIQQGILLNGLTVCKVNEMSKGVYIIQLSDGQRTKIIKL